MPDIDKAVANYHLDEYYGKALDLITSGKARDAFAIDREDEKMRQRYGMNTFGQSLLLARRLVEAGTRVVEVIWPKVANSDNHSWDTHAGLTSRIKGQAGPMFDQGFSAFIEDLDSRGLLDETLVVALGEFGRTPEKGISTSGNVNSSDGRDHWPYCYTATHRRRRHQARLRPRRIRRHRLQPEERPRASHRTARHHLPRLRHRSRHHGLQSPEPAP